MEEIKLTCKELEELSWS